MKTDAIDEAADRLLDTLAEKCYGVDVYEALIALADRFDSRLTPGEVGFIRMNLTAFRLIYGLAIRTIAANGAPVVSLTIRQSKADGSPRTTCPIAFMPTLDEVGAYMRGDDVPLAEY